MVALVVAVSVTVVVLDVVAVVVGVTVSDVDCDVVDDEAKKRKCVVKKWLPTEKGKMILETIQNTYDWLVLGIIDT